MIYRWQHLKKRGGELVATHNRLTVSKTTTETSVGVPVIYRYRFTGKWQIFHYRFTGKWKSIYIALDLPVNR
jgi:hypothetical protein